MNARGPGVGSGEGFPEKLGLQESAAGRAALEKGGVHHQPRGEHVQSPCGGMEQGAFWEWNGGPWGGRGEKEGRRGCKEVREPEWCSVCY